MPALCYEMKSWSCKEISLYTLCLFRCVSVCLSVCVCSDQCQINLRIQFTLLRIHVQRRPDVLTLLQGGTKLREIWPISFLAALTTGWQPVSVKEARAPGESGGIDFVTPCTVRVH